MFWSSLVIRTGVACAAAALAGCGHHGSSGGPVLGGGQPSSPSTAAYGTVASFGSVIVNGVRYQTSTAQFTVDGSPGSEDDLAVGDVVLVRGTLDSGGTTGVASSVVFDDQVQAPIGALDAAAGTLLVLGQIVRIDADTSFDAGVQPASLAGLAVGTVVEISGFRRGDGSIAATRIEPKPAASERELTGVVANHDSVAHRFNVAAAVVDYTAVSQLQNFPTGGIADGQLVEVRGGTVTNGTFAPSRIEFKTTGLAGAANERRELEGFITRFASVADFAVAGLDVATNGQTIFVGGQAADLAQNVKVEVEGALNAAGALVAGKVHIRRPAASRIAALVDSVNPVAGSFVVLGITVRVDALTRIEDKTAARLRPFAVANLAVGNYVEVRGVEETAANWQVLGTLVEREAPGAGSELRGFVESVTRPLLTVLGVQISTDGGTQFRDVNDQPLTATQFFSQLTTGGLVKVGGTEVGTRALVANRVELEN